MKYLNVICPEKIRAKAKRELQKRNRKYDELIVGLDQKSQKQRFMKLNGQMTTTDNYPTD